MTETIDELIQARFNAVATPAAEGDWGDVLMRVRSTAPSAQRRAPLRVALAAAVAVLAATVTAAAFGWPGRVVDFFKAPAAPQSIKTFFSAHNAVIPRGVSPGTKLGQPREVMTATFDADHLPPRDATLHTLYVAPRTGGGFCYLWTRYGGGCADPEDAAEAKTDPAARPVGFTWLENDYTGLVDGWIRSAATTVEARFADGTTASVPITRVSAPISAGFFAYVVPAAHLTRADALTSIVVLDASGNVVGKQTFALTEPLDQDVMQTLPDGQRESLPRRAQAARARKLFSFRTANGGQAYLWVMPLTGGGVCFLYGRGTGGGGGGCPSRYWLARIPAVDGAGLNGVFFAQVKPDIAAVELRFEKGGSQRLVPIDGFVLHQMSSEAPLVAVVGLDRSGKAIFRQRRPTG